MSNQTPKIARYSPVMRYNEIHLLQAKMEKDANGGWYPVNEVDALLKTAFDQGYEASQWNHNYGIRET